MNIVKPISTVVVKSLAVLIVLAALTPSTARSDSAYYFSTRTLAGYHKDRVDDTLVPFSQYGLFHFTEPETATDIWLNFRYARSLMDTKNRFDLFHGEARIGYFRRYATVDVGRLQLVEGMDYYLLDGAKLEGEITPSFRWSLFGGLTREPLLNESINTGHMEGGRLQWFPSADFSTQVGFLAEDYNDGAQDRRVGLYMTRRIRSPLRIGLDGNVEYSMTGKHLSGGHVSSDFRFSEKWASNVTYLYRNPLTNRTTERDAIFDVFAVSGFHSGKIGAAYTSKKIYLLVEPQAETDFYRATDASMQWGYRAALGVRTLSNPTGVLASLRYSFWDSWGGRSHLFNCTVSRRLTRALEFALTGESVFYRKRSNESAVAHRAMADLTLKVFKRYRLTGSVEGITNERYRKDIRALLMLEADLGPEGSGT